jgi:hypothetical protein
MGTQPYISLGRIHPVMANHATDLLPGRQKNMPTRQQCQSKKYVETVLRPHYPTVTADLPGFGACNSFPVYTIGNTAIADPA